MPKNSGYAVLGLGAFGISAAKALTESKQEVVAIDANEAAIDAIKDLVTEALIGNITNRDLLKELGVQDLRAAIVCVGEDLEASILATLALKDLGCPNVIAKADSREHRQILERLGADRVVLPEIQTARDLIQGLVNPAVMERYVLGPGHSIIKSPVPPSWVGRTLLEIGVRRDHGVSVIAVERCPEGFDLDAPAKKRAKVIANPEPALLFESGDRLILLGSDQQLQAFQVVK